VVVYVGDFGFVFCLSFFFWFFCFVVFVVLVLLFFYFFFLLVFFFFVVCWVWVCFLFGFCGFCVGFFISV